MIISGEKYACEACIRGHRVSSCTHSERKLLHVNKKGRPVSQCPHCRSLRKNRSQHVKCECHDKSHAKEDCPHLKDLQEGKEPSPPASGTCCCGHGARCTCSLKKEPYLDTVPEDFSQMLQQSKEALKHRGPNVNNHDTKATIFANGHHKPVHKFNDAHNHCGAPYRVPSRSNSHNHGQSHRDIAQRSSDSLPLTTKPIVHHESPLHNVLNASHPPRQAFSEHSSPVLAPTSVPNISYSVEIPPLSPGAYSFSPFDSHTPAMQPQQHLPDDIPGHWFTTHDEAHNNGPPSVPELEYIDWSKYGFAPQPSPALDSSNNMKTLYAGLASSQMPSYATSIEHLNQFGSGFNTSSGEISEVEDMPANFRPSNLRSISHASNDHSSVAATEDDSTNHRLSTASSYHGTPAGNALADNFDNLDIDKFIAEQAQKNMQQRNFTYQSPQSISTDLASQQYQQAYPPQQHNFQQSTPQQLTPPQSQHTMSTPPESIRGFSITSHPSPEESSEHYAAYSIKEAQAQAHQNYVNERKEEQYQIPMPVVNDPMWGQGNIDQYGNMRGFTLDDEEEDKHWTR